MTLFGLFAAAGAVSAILWLKSRHREFGVSENDFWAAIWLMALGSIVGAKVLFLILGWHHYATGELRFWGDFRTGFVFFGGLLGAVGTAALFARARRLDFWRGADYFAVALPAGHAIGRIGCFFAGCCPGRPPHPVQLYEAAGLMLISVSCFLLLSRCPRLWGTVGGGQECPRYGPNVTNLEQDLTRSKLGTGSLFCVYLFGYGLLRLVLDPLRADGRPERFWGISHQQGLALGVMLLAGVSALCRNEVSLRQACRDGRVACRTERKQRSSPTDRARKSGSVGLV